MNHAYDTASQAMDCPSKSSLSFEISTPRSLRSLHPYITLRSRRTLPCLCLVFHIWRTYFALTHRHVTLIDPDLQPAHRVSLAFGPRATLISICSGHAARLGRQHGYTAHCTSIGPLTRKQSIAIFPCSTLPSACGALPDSVCQIYNKLLDDVHCLWILVCEIGNLPSFVT